MQAQLSADISALESGEATFACYCTPRGQVIGLLLVGRKDDTYLVVASSDLLPGILARLQMFVLRSKVEFSTRADLCLYGIDQAGDVPAPGVFQPNNVKLHYLFAKSTDEAGVNPEQFREQEIRSRVTWLGSGTTEKFIPQMLGYENIGALSFTKGCYPGQEIVARTHYLGKVKRKPVVLEVEEKLLISPASRVELLLADSWSGGTVIDSVARDENGTLFFIVTAKPDGAEPEQLKHLDRTYRCATI